MIIPTRRLFFIALSGVIVIGLVGRRDPALLVAALWLACLAIIAVVDSRFVPARNRLPWRRDHESKLSLGAWNPVSLTLTNRSSRPARLRVRDAVPQLLVPRGETAEAECGPGQSWTLSYHVYPVHRGDYSFGPITARYLGPLGLAWRQYATRLEDQVKVYPNLLAVRTYEALIRRGHLEEIGLRASRRLGSGTEFERLREYTPDDEFRRINWTATARRHTPIAVEYQTERSQNVMLLIDAGRLMSTQVPYAGEMDESPFPGRGSELDGPRQVVPALTKLDHAINSALLLAYVSQQRGDRVGLMAFSDQVSRFVKPAAGRRQFLTLTEVLYNLEPQGTESNYTAALGYLAARSSRRALIVVFTDLAHEAAAQSLITSLAYLARRHVPLVVTMRDPAIETVAAEFVSNARSVYERAVARNFLDQRDLALSRMRQAGALTLDVPADQLSPSVINRYLEIKARSLL